MDNWQAYKRAAVKVVPPRHSPVTFILHDFMDVMLMKMKGLFADINILNYELYYLYMYFLLYIPLYWYVVY